MKRTFLILGIFLFTHAATAQWTIKHIDENSNRTGKIKFKNDSLGLFMGSGSTLLKTNDIGETWSKKQLNIVVKIKDFQFVGDSSVFAIGDHYTDNGKNRSGKLITSENLGENWDSISILTGKQLYSLWFFNSDSGVVAGYDGIYRTVNRGRSWDTVWSITQFGYKYGELKQITFPSPNIGYAIGIGRNPSNNLNFDHFLLKSNDSGVTWDSVTTFGNSSLSSIFFVDQNLGFVGAESGLLFKTSDGGNNWTETQIASSWNGVKSIQFISGNEGYATGGARLYLTSGGSSNFFISKTVDGGENWTSYDTIGVALNSIYFINDKTGFVAGDYELIMKFNEQMNKLPENYPWHLIESMDVDDNKIQNSNIKIYPNPVNREITIRSASGDRIQSVELISLRGESVLKQAGIDKSECQVLIGHLPKGAYILNVKTKGELKNQRIIIQ